MACCEAIAYLLLWNSLPMISNNFRGLHSKPCRYLAHQPLYKTVLSSPRPEGSPAWGSLEAVYNLIFGPTRISSVPFTWNHTNFSFKLEELVHAFGKPTHQAPASFLYGFFDLALK